MASMDLLAPASSQVHKKTTIPLVCNICARKPKFSDLSHLLTHISSKAHLSTYYKLKVRSGSDDADRQSVEDYDIWYAENDIESFMSDRMKQKDERKRIKTEPQASGRVIKKESDSPTITPLSSSYDDVSSVYPHPYAAYAPMYSWATHPYLYHHAKQEEASFDEDGQQIHHDQALTASKRPAKSQIPHVGDAEEDDTSKLKGIVWPGMGLFDAATPELKKKRNQKKDVSVNDRLAAMSEIVQQNEMIFSPSGRLCKVRTISGQPQAEDDVLPGEEQPPRPPKGKKAIKTKPFEDGSPIEDKKPLKNKNPDTMLKSVVRAKPKKRGRKQKIVAIIGAETQEVEPSEENVPRRTGRNKRKRPRTFDTDEAGQAKAGVQEATFEQPAVMTHLTSGYQQAPMYVAAAPMGFRIAEPTYMNMNMNINMAGQSYYQFPAGHNNPFTYEPSPLPTWDHFGYGIGSSIANPLFAGMYGGSFGEDDEDNEGTISAPVSDPISEPASEPISEPISES
ncbi:hypothetical protein AUEXF2481DRAFT_31436 [Aureobasidium subglaciale EXF-2481]|uniref:Uncharacterized protein n=1 Tax=Aureobasidium subglaciale (strain EXF-2481) TaxID=1043005 RepID=A0A074Y6L2_AURSE|nr:uncharacterized protein AUEXF2481DRAFT_31436 [Aureobasidium subglaciale EXF-2481]KAI5199708.1 hypothetical protein E4T38_06896 [Aureobasidium subglaciale]KAI5218475.1 hypothetical protein E4T40_06827 [Aureobasidium subglaciale]KAI5222169.1 hypothetical protein E4T41_06747 [Aureobasidium subglaciale]KAI5259700.1 hypothetical protein E4T46_06725 [Aureobasidium subglaciale]KEQ93423.1 hypothetical protein AUEXF2481DRAFT_31436 [Aureobasidium subglaciale EXF-2481]